VVDPLRPELSLTSIRLSTWPEKSVLNVIVRGWPSTMRTWVTLPKAS